jgi:iron-sulfur cluster insertion protein
MIKNDLHLYVEKTAKEKIEKLMLEKNEKNIFFRIYIIGGGCSGFQYGFNFDKKSDDDYILASDKIIIDEMSAQYLFNAGLYFEKSLYGEKFVIKNPNVKTTCGCGSSFSI